MPVEYRKLFEGSLRRSEGDLQGGNDVVRRRTFWLGLAVAATTFAAVQILATVFGQASGYVAAFALILVAAILLFIGRGEK